MLQHQVIKVKIFNQDKSQQSFNQNILHKNDNILTWFLCGLWYSTHSDMKYATIAFPPRAVTCARTMARTSVTKL